MIERISDASNFSLLWRLNTRRRIKHGSIEISDTFPLFPLFSLLFFSPVRLFHHFYGSLIESIAKVARDLFIPFSIVIPRNFSSPRAASRPSTTSFFFFLSPLAYCFFVIGKQLTIYHRYTWYTNSPEQRTRLDEFISPVSNERGRIARQAGI